MAGAGCCAAAGAAGCEAGAGPCGAAAGSGAVAGMPSPSRSIPGDSERIIGVRFISSLSVPDPVAIGRVEISIVLSAASSISEVERPMVVIVPIWDTDETLPLNATTP